MVNPEFILVHMSGTGVAFEPGFKLKQESLFEISFPRANKKLVYSQNYQSENDGQLSLLQKDVRALLPDPPCMPQPLPLDLANVDCYM